MDVVLSRWDAAAGAWVRTGGDVVPCEQQPGTHCRHWSCSMRVNYERRRLLQLLLLAGDAAAELAGDVAIALFESVVEGATDEQRELGQQLQLGLACHDLQAGLACCDLGHPPAAAIAAWARIVAAGGIDPEVAPPLPAPPICEWDERLERAWADRGGDGGPCRCGCVHCGRVACPGSCSQAIWSDADEDVWRRAGRPWCMTEWTDYERGRLLQQLRARIDQVHRARARTPELQRGVDSDECKRPSGRSCDQYEDCVTPELCARWAMSKRARARARVAADRARPTAATVTRDGAVLVVATCIRCRLAIAVPAGAPRYCEDCR